MTTNQPRRTISNQRLLQSNNRRRRRSDKQAKKNKMQHLIVDKRLNLTPSAASIAAVQQPRSAHRPTINHPTRFAVPPQFNPPPSIQQYQRNQQATATNLPQPSPTSTIATPMTHHSNGSSPFSTEPIRNDSYHGEKLKGLENYQVYRFQTQAWLEQRNLDYWLYHLPDTTVKVEKASHARAKSLFTVSIEADQIPYIQTCNYVKHIWETFETMYAPTNNLEQLTATQIQLNNTKMTAAPIQRST